MASKIQELVSIASQNLLKNIELLAPHILEFERLGITKDREDYVHMVTPVFQLIEEYNKGIILQIYQIAQSLNSVDLATQAEKKILDELSEYQTALMPSSPITKILQQKAKA